MKRLLIIIATDPRTSPRPAEAVRIAAGVGAWKKVEVLVYLRGAAVLALGEYADDLMDEDNFTRYLPIVGEWRSPLYVQQGTPLLRKLGASPFDYREISDQALADLAASCAYVARF